MDATDVWEDAFMTLAIYICIAKSPNGLTEEEISDALNGLTPEEITMTCIRWIELMKKETTKGDK